MTVVELNVGGAKFTTTTETLTKEPESMLARLFDGDLPPCQRDQKARQVHHSFKPSKAPANTPSVKGLGLGTAKEQAELFAAWARSNTHLTVSMWPLCKSIVWA